MKTRYILYPLLMLLAMLLPTSCSLEEDLMEVAASSNGDKITFNMGVSVPGASNVQSRAFADGDTYSNDDKYFKSINLHIAVFEISSTGTFLKKFVSADLLKETDSDKDNDVCTNFRVTLTQAGGVNKSYRLHVIANYPGLELNFDNEVQLMSSLAADGANHDVYWNFVELNEISQTSLAKLLHVPLVRNYAKISLRLPTDASKLKSFTFTGYKLYNVPQRGTVAAYNPNASNKFTQFVATNSEGELIKDNNGKYTLKDYATIIGEKYVGNEPYNDGSLYGETGWITIPEEQSAIPSTFMYERRQTDASGTPVSNTTYMIIKGTWDDADEVYYKLDFAYTADNGNTVYYNLLRNFHYTMNVSEISGPGYTTEDAAKSHPACNNISASAELKDFTNISNGVGQLYVSTTYVMFTNNTPIDIYYKYIPDLDNKVNGVPKINNTIGSTGVSITPQQKAEPVLTSATPADTDVNDTNSQYSGWRKVTLTPVGTVPSSARLQKVTISAGGLSRTIELEYRQPIPGMSVVVYDGDNDEIDKKDNLVGMDIGDKVKLDITLPAGIPESLFPLRLFIRSAGNTIYPDYGTNMPAETQNGNYGFIKELSYDAYNTSKTVTCDFLTNCENSATTVYVQNQYLATADAAFENEWESTVTLGTDIRVDIEQVYGRYPQTIYGNGTDNGTKEGVKVTYNGTELTETISINKVNVTSGMDFVSVLSRANINGTLSPDDEVVFTFTDQHWLGGNNWTPENSITYRAETTLGEIADGTTLEFKPESTQKITTITIGTTQVVTVEARKMSNNGQSTSVYPYKLHDNSTESVTVKNEDNQVVGNITIDSDNVTTAATLTDDDGFDTDEKLTFTFVDRYCTKATYSFRNWSYTWSADNTNGRATYSVTCTVEALLNGTAKLDFKTDKY